MLNYDRIILSAYAGPLISCVARGQRFSSSSDSQCLFFYIGRSTAGFYPYDGGTNGMPYPNRSTHTIYAQFFTPHKRRWSTGKHVFRRARTGYKTHCSGGRCFILNNLSIGYLRRLGAQSVTRTRSCADI